MARLASSDSDPALVTVPADRAVPSTARLVPVLMSLAILGPLSIDMYLPALPALQHELGASASLAQLTLSACLLGLAGGQLIAGPLSDSIGRRPPVIVGMIGFTVMALACSLAPNIWLLILFRFLQGLFGSAGVVISRAVIRDLYSGVRASQVFSLLVLANGAGPILAPTLGGIILIFTDWRGVFGVMVVLGAVLLAVAGRFLPETSHAESRTQAGVGTTLQAFGVLLRDRTFMGYALVMGMGMCTMFAHVAGSSFIMQNIYGVSEQAFAILFGVIAIGYIGMSQVNARLITRVPMRSMLVLGVTLNLVGASLLFLEINAFHAGLWALVGGLFLVAMSNGFIGPNVTALSLQEYPHMAGSAAAMLGLLTFIGGAAVAPLVGIAGDHTAVPQSVIILGCSVVGALACLFVMRRSARMVSPAA